ncbi:MAG: hypothetical protein KAX78_06665, partial [Phycisphaerae bacterium]|nr:hypothetical protein [Phycisphaerae bacterium]
RVYVEQAKRGGIRFARPDVNRSHEDFTIEGDAIRVGLRCIEQLGPAATAAILKARDEGLSKGVNDFLTETAGEYEERPFKELSDFLTRTAGGYEEARALILCGAFDWTGRTRPELIVELELFRHTRRPGQPGQKHLLTVSLNVPKLPADYSADRKYRDERRILGFSTGKHIMSLYRPDLGGVVDTDSRRLGEKIGERVKIAGVLEASRTTRTQAARTMRFLTLDDEYGLFEVTVFPGARCTGRSLSRYGPYIVTGTVQEQYDAITIWAEDIRFHELPSPSRRAKKQVEAT